VWLPSVHIWIKYNTDGVGHGSPNPASYGGIFRDYQANFGCFVSNIDILYALNAEIMDVILAIELAYETTCTHLCLESDSKLINLVFTQSKIIPWNLYHRWQNYLDFSRNTNFKVTHIYKEENCCVGRMTNISISVSSLTWWDNLPNSIKDDFHHNRLCLPLYKFYTFSLHQGFIS